MKLSFRSTVHMALAGGALLALSAGVGNALPKSGTYVQELVTADRRGSTHVTTEFDFKGDKSRYVVSRGEGDSVIVITTGSTTYVYEPKFRHAYKTNPREGAPKTLAGVAAADAKLVKNAKKVGKERVMGRSCIIYESKPGKGVVNRYWISIDKEFPLILRRVTILPREMDGSFPTLTTEIQAVKLNVSINDSIFKLPKGTRIVPRPTNDVKVHQPLRGRR